MIPWDIRGGYPLVSHVSAVGLDEVDESWVALEETTQPLYVL
jgi:hypothetical protein